MFSNDTRVVIIPRKLPLVLIHLVALLTLPPATSTNHCLLVVAMKKLIKNIMQTERELSAFYKLSDKMGPIEFEIDLRSTKVLQTDSTTKPKEKTWAQELAELSAPMDNNCPSVDSYSKDLQDSPVTLSPSLMPANLVQEALADFRLLSSEEQKYVVDRLEGTRLKFINIMKAPDGLNLDKEVSCSNANRSPSSSNPPAVSPDTVFELPTKAIVHHMSHARSDTILSPASANLVNLKNGCIQQNVTDIVSLGDGN
uniref:Uncharacterized protein n=1 Tax=Sphaerodactylus townsendi TaxID=933632 RepID=A0ACB8GDM1_9SAUR